MLDFCNIWFYFEYKSFHSGLFLWYIYNYIPAILCKVITR